MAYAKHTSDWSPTWVSLVVRAAAASSIPEAPVRRLVARAPRQAHYTISSSPNRYDVAC
jgi:hypothetical protein